MKKTLLALAAFAASTLFATPGAACLNEVLRNDDANQLLATAQQEVDRGELAAARDDARKAVAGRFAWEGTQGEWLVNKAMRIMALADARDPNAEQVALVQDVDIVANIRRTRTDDPVIDAEYAEILARIPGRSGEAHDILAPLVKRDLVGSPWALATLARVSKDEKESADARAACARVGGEPWICAERVAAPQKWYGPISKSKESIGGGVMAGGAALVLGIGGVVTLVIARRRRRAAAALSM